MGISIDDCIDYYNRSFAIGDTDCERHHNDILEMTISTMRKYQKIEQIIKDHDNDRIPEDYWYIDRIREVLEDGKID